MADISKIKLPDGTTYNLVDTDTTYTLSTSGNKVTLTPSSGSVQSITVPYSTLSNTVNGVYTANGGQQGPAYFGKNRAGFLMSNASVAGDSHYKNWLYMDNYNGTDVGGATAFGIDRTEPRAFIMQSDANRTSWNNTAALGVFTATPTSGQVVVTDGTTGGIKSSGYTIAKSVPSNAVFTDNNTTYTFANGTNGFTVTPSGGTAQTVTVTPSITNNVTGSGTSGYLTKFNGAHTITNGPQLGSSTTTFLRNDGTWATPSTGTDTKNTAGSTNNTSKLFLVGALEQSANPQTYSNSDLYINGGVLYSKAFRARTNNVNLCEVGNSNNAGALLVNDSTGGYSVWMRGDTGQISCKIQNVVENVDNAWKRRVRNEVDTTDHSGIITHFGKTTWYQGDNVPKVMINADDDAGITVSQSNGAPAVTMYGSDISSSLLMFSRENDDPSSTLHNTIYLNASGASGTILAFGDNGNSYAGLIGDESRVVCERMSHTNETVTFSKSSGSWTFRDGECTRSGQVVQIRISFKGGSSNVSVGSNAIAGTINGIPTPPYTVRLQGYYSGTILMGELTTSGGFNVRILGQALNLSSSNAATLSGTYVVED